MKKRRYFLSFLLFFILFLITYFWIFRCYDFKFLIDSLKLCNIKYILLAILSMFMFPLFEAIFLKSIARNMGIEMSFYKALGYVFTEIYFSGITPSSMGGQPVQMYEMNRDGIEYYKSSIIVLLNTVIYKCTLVFLLILSLIFFGSYIFSYSTLFNVLVLIGFVMNVLIILFFISLVYSKKTIDSTRKIFMWFVNRFKFIKNKEVIFEKFDKTVLKYNDLSDFTRKKPFIFVKSFMILLMQRISFLLVSYFIYKSFGLDGFSIFLVIAFQVCIVMAGDFIPTPGGVMVYEGIILSINELLYGEELALSSMLLQRSINFYLLILISFIIYLVFHYDKKRRKRKEKILNEKKYS